MDKILAIANPHKDDRAHVESILKAFPQRWAFGFARKYSVIMKEQGRQAANLYLIERQESIKPHQIGLASSDEEISNAAKAKAKRYWERLAGSTDLKADYEAIAEEIALLGVAAPKPKKGTDYTGECERLKCPLWWRRALRVAVSRHVEHEAIKAGFVGFRAAYASNEAVDRRRQQNKRNQQTLEWIQAENDAGYKATLAELSKAGVSNPENRKNELMTRIRGIEEEAKRKGLGCEFITITAPSKFHATSGGRTNPKYNGSTPKQAQAYLVKLWSLIRAKLQREGLQPVGFRVSEPHKDATPHWHMMLFIEKKHAYRLRQICRAYAMKEDAGEAGAHKHRFTAVSIDPSKGSAAGYIAKYIAKNIDMGGIEDFESTEGGSVKANLERSVAWAALWGIRQFQQQGGERITYWRELRRIRTAEGMPEIIQALWKAADAGEYGAFIREALNRQISLIRESQADLPLYGVDGMHYKPNHKGEFNQIGWYETGRLITAVFNRYGEIVTGAIKGVCVDGEELLTRTSQWSFSYKGETGEAVKMKTNHKIIEYIETEGVSKKHGSLKAAILRAEAGINQTPFFSFLDARRASLGLV